MDTELKTFWVEVLLDDGALHGVPVDGYLDDLETVGKDAMDNALTWMKRPVHVVVIADNDTDEIVWERQ